MIRLPNKIVVGGKTYKIARRNKILNSGDFCWGTCDVERGLIEIQTRGVSLDHQLETLLHEALHAIEDHIDVRLKEPDLTKLSKALYALLKDNL